MFYRFLTFAAVAGIAAGSSNEGSAAEKKASAKADLSLEAGETLQQTCTKALDWIGKLPAEDKDNPKNKMIGLLGKHMHGVESPTDCEVAYCAAMAKLILKSGFETHYLWFSTEADRALENLDKNWGQRCEEFAKLDLSNGEAVSAEVATLYPDPDLWERFKAWISSLGGNSADANPGPGEGAGTGSASPGAAGEEGSRKPKP
jgi:hypothetical protein